MPCSACHRDIKLVGRGLCRACYQRWYKKGTTDYEPKRARTFCQIDECGKPVVANGLCDMHRQRLWKHGHTEQTRADDWGTKIPTGRERHPLFNSWAYLRKHRGRHPVSPLWIDDFLQFVADVGERPSRKHKLFSADETLPIGPGNFLWKRAVTERAEGEDEATANNRRQRAYRALRPEAYQGYELKKRFGITKERYDEMSAEQGHLCAICGQPETAKIRDRTLTLAVDHCHSHGHIRALLCRGCNTALGGFRDDPNLLRAAIAYLEKHLPPPA